jgi:dTDP-glucose pyrophosphorylase
MINWQKVVLDQNDKIQSAVEVLNNEALRIVMIVDESKQLVGTVTDGDIRRGLIKHISIDAKISEIMFKKPTVVLEGTNQESIINKMKELDLLQIPIIDSNKQVVGMETLHHLLKKDVCDNPVFLMAGGFGKRLKPLTDSTPKPLLKVGNKPILENILEQFIATGFHKFYISTHYKAEMVREYFGDGSNWNVSIEYIHEETPLGTAGGLGLLPNNLTKLPILVMNGDLLTKVNFEQLLNFHLQEGGAATMCVREYDFQVPYGVIKADGRRIISIQEKPIQSFFVNAGIYVLNPSILDAVDGKNYLDMTQLLEDKIENDEQVNLFPIHEYWLDIGGSKQFDRAQKDLRELF